MASSGSAKAKVSSNTQSTDIFSKVALKTAESMLRHLQCKRVISI